MNFDEWRDKHAETDDDTDTRLAWDYQQARIDAIDKLVNKYCLNFNDKTPASEILCQIAEILENDTTTN